MPETYGAMHMSSDQKYEVQRQNHFQVYIPNIDGENDIMLAVEESPFPSESSEVIELDYMNTKVKVAGKTTFEDLDIQYKDFIEVDVELKLKNWRRKVYDPNDDSVGLASEYKRDGFIYEYAPNGTMKRTWVINGVWPSSYSAGDGSHSSSDKKLVNLTLSIDKAYRKSEKA